MSVFSGRPHSLVERTPLSERTAFSALSILGGILAQAV